MRPLARPPARPAGRPPARPVQPPSAQSVRPDYNDPEYEEQRQDEYVDERSGRKYDPQGEEIIFRINPAFYPVAASYFVSIIGALLVAGAVAYLRGSFWIVLIFSVVFITPAIVRHIIFVQTIYTLTTVKIEVRTGLFSKNSRNIPLRHIQDVYVSETFKERMLGIGDVVIDTAATESKMSLDNINEPRKYADMILDQLHNWN